MSAPATPTPTLGEQIDAVWAAANTHRADKPYADTLRAAARSLETVAQAAAADGYHLARVTPHWTKAKVFDAVTGEAIGRVIEAHVGEGWIVQRPARRDQPTVRTVRPIRVTYGEEA